MKRTSKTTKTSKPTKTPVTKKPCKGGKKG